MGGERWKAGCARGLHGLLVICERTRCISSAIDSYKRVKGRSHTVERRISMHPHKSHATLTCHRYTCADLVFHAVAMGSQFHPFVSS